MFPGKTSMKNATDQEQNHLKFEDLFKDVHKDIRDIANTTSSPNELLSNSSKSTSHEPGHQ